MPRSSTTPPTPEQNRVLHRTIQGVTQDIERMFFNTAIAKMMEFTNFFLKEERRPRAAMETLVLLLSPFAPHMAEELWQLLGHAKIAGLRALARVRRSGHQGRHDRSAGAGQRQAARPHPRAGRCRCRGDRGRGPRRCARSPSYWPARRSSKSSSVPGRLVNFVVK